METHSDRKVVPYSDHDNRASPKRYLVRSLNDLRTLNLLAPYCYSHCFTIFSGFIDI